MAAADTEARRRRAQAAIVGAAVADAATRPFHWQYDVAAITAKVGDGECAFFGENCSPFYDVPLGHHSCYCDQVLVGLASANACGGRFDARDLETRLVSAFGHGPYQDALALRESAQHYDPATKRRWRVPVPGPWLQKAVITFLANRAAAAAGEGGGDDRKLGDSESMESDGFCVSLALSCVKAVESDGSDAAEAAADDDVRAMISVLSLRPACVSFALAASRILRRVIRTGAAPLECLRAELLSGSTAPGVAAALAAVETALPKPHTDASDDFGQSCAYPETFQCALHAVSTAASFGDAVRLLIRAGGCSCSRAVFAGALMAAHLGVEGIPEGWLDMTVDGAQVVRDADALLAPTK